MSKKNLIVCDSCGKEKGMDESTGTMWLVVASAASTEEYQNALLALQDGADFKSIVDAGDFCGLVCLANWASARANLRDLDAERDG